MSNPILYIDPLKVKTYVVKSEQILRLSDFKIDSPKELVLWLSFISLFLMLAGYIHG